MLQNPLRVDPTRTATLRRRYMADMVRRLERLRKKILALLLEEDAFGLQPNPLLKFNQRWRFRTDDGKLKGFREWLEAQIQAEILSIDISGRPWQATYIYSAYRAGVVRAFLEANRKNLAQNLDFFDKSQAQFLRAAFQAPETVSKLELLYTRAFEDLKGVSSSMGSQLNRIIADGLANGNSPRVIASNITKQVDITKVRALTIARTEVIHAHAEGQLDSYERLGVEELGILAEWITAGDGRVCPICQSYAGQVFTVARARGMIPAHPNCRCTWIPFVKASGVKRKAA